MAFENFREVAAVEARGQRLGKGTGARVAGETVIRDPSGVPSSKCL